MKFTVALFSNLASYGISPLASSCSFLTMLSHIKPSSPVAYIPPTPTPPAPLSSFYHPKEWLKRQVPHTSRCTIYINLNNSSCCAALLPSCSLNSMLQTSSPPKQHHLCHASFPTSSLCHALDITLNFHFIGRFESGTVPWWTSNYVLANLPSGLIFLSHV